MQTIKHFNITKHTKYFKWFKCFRHSREKFNSRFFQRKNIHLRLSDHIDIWKCKTYFLFIQMCRAENQQNFRGVDKVQNHNCQGIQFWIHLNIWWLQDIRQVKDAKGQCLGLLYNNKFKFSKHSDNTFWYKSEVSTCSEVSTRYLSTAALFVVKTFQNIFTSSQWMRCEKNLVFEFW